MSTEIDTLLDFSDEADDEDKPTAEVLARLRAHLEAAAILPNGVAGFCGSVTAEWRGGERRGGYRVRLVCDPRGAEEDYIYYHDGEGSAIEDATPVNLAFRLKPFAGAGRGNSSDAVAGSIPT